MPGQMFQLDRKELDRLVRLYKRMPREFQQATARMLNSFAFGTQKEAIKVIQRRMTVRNQRFVKSAVRVRKARGSDQLTAQEAITGSIFRARFSGWREQELGKATDRTRIATIFARGGDKGKQIRPSLRMKSNNQFLSPDDFPGNSAAHRVVVMLQVLSRKRHRRPFIIKHHPKFKPGLYKFQRRKLHMVQDFNPSKPQPRRIRWMTSGRKRYFRGVDLRALWTDNLNRSLKTARRK